MKFLHTGDLHLDSVFCLSNESEAAARRARARELLGEIFDLVKKEACDMVLISGDLFDRTYVTPETKKQCISVFADFAKPVVICPGNHDPYVDGSIYKSGELPENVWVFSSPELQFFDFPALDTTVAGFAFTSATVANDPLAAPLPTRHNGKVLLLCAHGDVDAPMSRYAPMRSSALSRHGFDYVALGHIHKYTELTENIRYCGFAEGRSFDELGEGGVLICETDGVGDIRVERKILSRRVYLWEELSVNPDMSAEDMTGFIREKISGLCTGKELYLRLRLVGAACFDINEILPLIRCEDFDSLCSLQIEDCTLCLPDMKALERDTTIKGEFYRSLMGELYSDERERAERAKRALYIGLAAIDGKDFTAVR